MAKNNALPEDTELQEFLRHRLHDFLRTVRACGLNTSEEQAESNFPLWRRQFYERREREAAKAKQSGGANE